MLCVSGETGYVHEPFNPNRSPGWFTEPLPYWFMHITPDNEGPYLERVRHMVELRYPTWRSLGRSRSLRLVAMNLQQSSLSYRDRLRRRRLLLKDPLALFSVEWLAERFGMLPVVLVRHPASFVGSIKRLQWGFDYERNWLAQPALMRDLLPGYEADFTDYHGEVDLVGEGIVVWRALNDVVSRYRDRHPDWAVLRYEDVAADPLPAFRALYEHLGLTWSGAVARGILTHSSGANPRDVPPERKHEIRRNSRAATQTWRARLTEAEIERVRRGTEDVWRRFYDDADW